LVKRTLAALGGALLCLSLPVGAAPNGFSCTLPAGWQALDLKHAPKTLRLLASPAGNAAATFSVQDVSSALPPDRYVQHLLLTLKASAPQTRVLSRGAFVTASGLHGSRAVFDEIAPGGSVHFVVCAFSGPGHRRLLVAGLWPAADTAKYDVAVSRSLKTFAVK
jgi:hypothetical protein